MLCFIFLFIAAIFYNLFDKNSMQVRFCCLVLLSSYDLSVSYFVFVLIMQMPRGVPVATVAVNNATNAGLLEVRILGVCDADLVSRLGSVT